MPLVKMDVQIRAIKTITAIGASDLAIVLDHSISTAAANPIFLNRPFDILE